MTPDLPIEYDGVLYWYVERYDPADDRCCYCQGLIPDEDVPLILWKGRGKQTLMARIHWEPCGQKLLDSGYLKMGQ